jgi:hypothetical protein
MKYESVFSAVVVLKHKVNPMKHVPFIEKLRPGFMLQFFDRNGDWTLDVNPLVGYRVTTRITVGAGWNQRFAYTFGQRSFNRNTTIFGPRVFGEFELWKGFSPRIEGEIMKTKVPFNIRTKPRSG